jgi:DNA-binding CsgD family transcriptional regulator/PAS domain-containing protein
MARANLDAVVSTIDSLLAGAYDTERMSVAVEQMRQLFDGSKACLARIGPDPDPSDAITTNPDAALQQLCAGELADDFVTFAAQLSQVPMGQVYSDHAVFGSEHLRASRLWQEWMAPQDMYGGLGCRLLEADASYWIFDIQRGRRQETFDAEDAALLARLRPILARVAAMRRQIGLLTLQRDMARSALDALSVGIILTDQNMQLAYANEAADLLLADPEGALSLQSGRIFARRQLDQTVLKRLVAEAFAPSCEPASGRGRLLARSPEAGGPNLSLCVSPLPVPGYYGMPDGPPCAMIAVSPLKPAADLAKAAQQLFALTETEARFASALASGQSLAEAADHQRVRMSTARTHLARIFQKTGTRQQSQVAALLRGAELPVRDSEDG